MPPHGLRTARVRGWSGGAKTAPSGGRAAASPVDVAVGPPRPSIAGYLPCAIGRRPSSPSAASASRRRGCGGGSWPAERRRAARVFQYLLFSLSRVDHAGKRQGGERNSLRDPRLYPEVTLLLCVFFLGFSRFVIGFASPCHSSSFIVDTPEGRDCCCALQAAATTFVIKPPYRCRRLFRRWRHSPPVFVKQALDLPPAFLARTSPPMFLKEDVVATPDLSATLAATCAVATPVLSVT